MKRRLILAMMIAGLGLGLTPALIGGPPRLIWNATASAPEGLYWLSAPSKLAVGDLVAIAPPPRLAGWLAARRALPKGALLIKQVAAVPPDRVCRTAGLVTLNGVPAARAQIADPARRPLPVWTGCQVLAGHQLFLLNAHPASLDGRYFGPLPRAAVVGRVRPIWILEHADAP